MLADKPFFLVLEEDGTTVETEEYFQSLADDTVFMVLHKGQKWQPITAGEIPPVGENTGSLREILEGY